MPIFLPENYGAIGNGVADDWQALTDMHTAAEASAGTGVGPIEMVMSPGKRYGVSKPWELRPTSNFNFRLVGSGDSLGGSRITALQGFQGSPIGGVRAAIFLPGTTVSGHEQPAYSMTGFAVTNEAGAACEAGIKWGTPGRKLGGLHPNAIEDISSWGFTNGFDIRTTGLLEFNRTAAWCASVANSFGYFIACDEGQQTSELVFNNCTADSSMANPDQSPSQGACIGLYNWTATGGINGIRFNNFNGYHAATYVKSRMTNTGGIGDIDFSNCQLDGPGGTGFDLLTNGGATPENWSIAGTYIRGSLSPFIVQAYNSRFVGLAIERSKLLNNGGSCYFTGTDGANVSNNFTYGGTAPGAPVFRFNNSADFNCQGNRARRDMRPGGVNSSFDSLVQMDLGCSGHSVIGNNAGNVTMTGGYPGNVRDLTGGAGTVGLNR